ncbi:AI-2E family transporter [Oleidesulfovibrio sp.]|uniref:AI-2E family transporter n=1 Tax=Oleidesulfovibrio sp. TaxID=2909707 RepID=UPI003A8B7084
MTSESENKSEITAENASCETSASGNTSGTGAMPFDGVLPSNRIYAVSLIILLLFSLWLSYRLLEPFLNTFIMGIVLSAICYPLYNWILEKTGHRSRTLASLAVLLFVCFCIALPLFIFITGLIPQAVQSVSALNNWMNHTDFDQLLKGSTLDPYLSWVRQNLPFIDLGKLDLRAELLGVSRKMGQGLLEGGTYLLGNALTLLFQFFLMLLIVFFMLKDGKKMLQVVKYMCPLHEDQEDAILLNLRSVSKSVLVGGLLVAALQGLVGGIGLWLVDIPALFWGTVMGFASLVPVVGTGLIWVPACLYLLLIGSWKASLFLFIWSALVVASIDSFLRPYFMRGGAGMSTFFIFMSILGGIKVFAMAGVLYGPLILSFTMVLLKLYGEEFSHVLSNRSVSRGEAKRQKKALGAK